jgi:HSP20 family protein
MTTELAKFLDHNFFEPYDILFKDLFNWESTFLPAFSAKSTYPTDVYEDENSITIEVAAVGLDKEDIQIEEADGVITIRYDKKDEVGDDKCNCLQHGITRKSFRLSWKFSDKFNLKKIEAQLDKGILKIQIPKEESKPKVIKNTIKIK